MKAIHLSDLHLGKRVNEFPMLDDQKYILGEILRVIGEEKPDAVFIAGDVYDKPVPPADAVTLFDGFLTDLARMGVQTFVISGNHDSPERIAFGGRLMDLSGVHMSPVYDGHEKPIPLKDADGTVWVHMLPFVRPVNVRTVWPDEPISTWTDALRTAVAHMDIHPGERNVLIAHQFVTGAKRSESEEVSVGGADNVDATVFAPFDYVALGHIHGPQNIEGDERIRYCGTPLKYSFSEKDHVKSVTVVELTAGGLSVRTVPLKPQRDMRELRGTYDELTYLPNYQGTAKDDYLRIILTDEQDVPDAMAKLRLIYPNLMKLEYDNTRTRSAAWVAEAVQIEEKSGIELFDELYEKQNGQPMSETQRRFAQKLLERLGEEAAE